MSTPVHALLAERLQADGPVHLLGEALELSDSTRGLRALAPGRVHLLPAADASLVGVALGMAMAGARPVVELADASSLWGALPQLGAEAHGLPVVLRVPLAPGQAGPWDALLGVEGLTVVAASGMAEAADLLRGALEHDGPVVLIDPMGGGAGQLVDPLPLTRARIHRRGDEVVLLAWGRGVHAADAAADRLAEEGLSASVLDLRCLSPLDTDTVAEHVRVSGRVVLVDGPTATLSPIVEAAFLRLEAPPQRASADPAAIIDAARRAADY